MAKRSVEITLLNNTNYYLQEYWEAIPHGSWGGVTGSPAPGAPLPNWSLPSTIAPLSTTTWSSADSEFSIGKGTEAWVKYSLLCGPPLGQANLLYFIGITPLFGQITTLQVITQCQATLYFLENRISTTPAAAFCQEGYRLNSKLSIGLEILSQS